MRLAKRATAVVLSAALLVSGLYVGSPAQAKMKTQVKYQTKKVSINTDLVPNDDNIQVEQGAGETRITTKKNVQFTLDCNVDCTWKVETYNGAALSDDVANEFKINQFGVVTVTANAEAGSYSIAATAKNVSNDEKIARCTVTVKASSQVEGEVFLDKESIEAYYAGYDLNIDNTPIVTVDGNNVVVNGHVANMPLYTKIEPEYVADKTVVFSTGDSTEASITGNNKLTTNKHTDKDGITLYATCGTSPQSKSFNLVINSRDYRARVDCSDIRSEDKDLTNNIYNIRMNEDLHFSLSDNEPYALEDDSTIAVDHIEWTMKYGANNESISSALSNGEGTVDTDLGEFVFGAKGKTVRLLTPLNDPSDPGYQKYVDRIEQAKNTSGANQITLDAVVYDVNGKQIYTLNKIILEFSQKENTFSTINIDFAAAGLVKGIDYSCDTVTINNKEEDVYVFESGEAIGNVLDLAEATKSNFSGVRDFEASQLADFDSNSTYMVNYYLQELTGVAEVYRNADIIDPAKNTEINATGKYLTPEAKGKLTKQGIGYFKLHVELTGKGGTFKTETDCIIRFVSSASGLSVQHKSPYTAEDLEYSGNAVIHVRTGEADVPTVSLNGEEVKVSLENPFLKFEVTEVLKGNGTVAEAYTESDGSFKISGISEGKVIVTATSVVDATESVSYLLYVNDETLELTKEQLEIDLSDAMKMGRISSTGEVQGHWTDIPVKVTVKNVPNAGIPKVTWSIVGDDNGTFAKIEPSPNKEGTAILTTLKSTGSSSIAVRATTVNNPDVYVDQTITIKDVYATSIVTLGEKVDAGKTGVLTNVANNAGTAKVGQQFTLEPKEYEPKNSTGVNGNITWSSSNDAIATVTQDGLVTTLAEGEVKIEAQYTSNTANETTTFNLTVSGYDQQVTSIQCEDNIVLTRVGDTKTLVVTVLPETVVNKAVTFDVTSGEDIITVSESGVITALKVGRAVITVTSVLTPSVKKTVNVEVKGLDDTTPGTTPPSSTLSPTPTATPPVTATQKPSTPKAPAKNTKAKVSGSTYVVTNASTSKGEVAMQKAKSGKSVTVPATVKINGYTYKVTSIKANAFKGNKKLKSVTIGKNVKSIGKNAFYGCTKLAKVTIQSKVLKSVGAKAFAKGSKKVTVTVPKKKASAYKKLLKKAGISKKAKYKKK